MTIRERWTVYPLLFLAIGLAVRATSIPPELFAAARIDRLECREIVVAGDDGTLLIHMGRVTGGGGGRIEVRDSRGLEAVAIGTRPGRREGAVEFFEIDGRESGRLTTTGLGDPPPELPLNPPLDPLLDNAPADEEPSAGPDRR